MAANESSNRPETYTTFGALLRYLRRRARLTQRELAIAVDYSEAQISRLEQNQRAPDPATVAARFIPALDLESDPTWANRLLTLAASSDRRQETGNWRQETGDRRLETGDRQLETGGKVLLGTKLFVPGRREALVARPRLHALLDGALRVPLTLVAAPAGFGKTTLIGDWLNQTDSQFAAAWLSLDAGDNDATSFLRYLIAALQTALPRVGETAMELLEAPQTSQTSILVMLINEVARADSCVLVLDDYHVITNSAIHEVLAFLIDHLPPSLHLLIASRSDPPLPLARLRARGQLLELRAADLRFAGDETRSFFADAMSLALDSDAIQTLQARTEGWAAGLQLAALAVRGAGNPQDFIATFAGTHRYVVDYLVEEVLDQLPVHLRTFLLQTSLLDRLCAALCDQIMGVASGDSSAYSQLILAELQRRNLFLVPLDNEGRWYRYHHLFAAVLRSRLHEGASPAEVAALHRRASDWYAANSLVAEAVQHALAAPDSERAASLVEGHALETVLRGEGATLRGWLAEIPVSVQQERPRLCLAQSWLQLSAGDYGAAVPWLERAESSLADVLQERDPTLHGAVLAVRSLLLSTAGDERGVALARQARALLPSGSPLLRLVAMGQGYTYLATGNPNAAAQTLLDALQFRDNDVPLLADRIGVGAFLCVVRLHQGKLHETLRGGEELIALASSDRRLLAFPSTLITFSALGAALIDQNDLDGAERTLRQGIELSNSIAHRPSGLFCDLQLALVVAARGDTVAALKRIAATLEEAEQQRVAPAMRREMAGWRALLWLRAGDVHAAEDWALADRETAGLRLTPYDYSRFVLAQAQMVRGQWAHALEMLETLRHEAERAGLGRFQLWSLLLLALARHALGDHEATNTALDAALALAAPQGAIRPFVDAGAPMAALLRSKERLLSDAMLLSYLQRIIAAFA